MPLTDEKRRLTLKLLGSIPFFSPEISAATKNILNSHQASHTLSYIIDVIIPRDATPSASDLQLHEHLFDLGNNIPNYTNLLMAGTQWIEQSAQLSFNTSFRKASNRQQHRLIEAAFSQAPRSLANVFINRVRNDVMALYYEHPSAWQELPINGPIQPLGYPEHADSII